ncbi:MAG: Xaa-Pro peptidase family protein [SAR324 cluster bacterium]|nr:Xaa-Pro peptidase family protein [SAR324 cluster bacterium]MCZ6729993.1 Xaa-Pro peptidase family protein [SAR324 cluster bacterium]
MPGSPREIIANISRLYALMDRDGLAAVVARSGKNFTYLSGMVFPGTLARHLDFPDSERGVMAVWPRNGEPALVLNSTAADLARRDSWVKELRLSGGYGESPYACLCTVLEELGLAGERIGLEKNYISAQDWEAVRQRLPRLEMVDCTAMMDEVRWIKTPGEIELLKRAADLLDEAFLATFATIRPGITEREIHSRLIFECLQRGAGWAHGILNSSSNPIKYGGEGDTVFQSGDVVHTDYVAYLEGYPGHQNRNAIVEAASAEQLSLYAEYRDVYLRVMAHCQPGVTAGEVYAYSIGEFEKRGWVEKSLLVGHSVGAWWHQQEPILTKGSEIVLEESMVLAVEPHLDHWSIQDLIVVRASGPELLSDKFRTEKPFITG